MIETAHLHFGVIGQRFRNAHPREDAEALTELAATVGELVEATRGELVEATRGELVSA